MTSANNDLSMRLQGSHRKIRHIKMHRCVKSAKDNTRSKVRRGAHASSFRLRFAAEVGRGIVVGTLNPKP